MNSYPIVVDLDGTLVQTDMLQESALCLVRNNPLMMLLLPMWLLHGKAMFKRRLSNLFDFEPGILPYNKKLLKWLRQQKNTGRKLILCTASDASIASSIANHVGIFDEVFSSDGKENLSGNHKARLLEQRFGRAGFDYVGNSEADRHVWNIAREAIVVNAPESLVRRVKEENTVSMVFPAVKKNWKIYLNTLRVHQWAKNLLVFMPLFASHQVSDVKAWLMLLLAFMAFNLCASAVYISNDLLDLNNDRRHRRKRNRPFASGAMPLWSGVLLVPFLLAGGFLSALYVGEMFSLCLLFYFLLTSFYSWWLKRLILLDCLVLAMLYTSRVISGTVAVSLSVSFWMLAFSVFLFLSLAFVKRYAELQEQNLASDKRLYGRGYCPGDASLVQTLGIVSGYISVLVLALYINSDAVVELYKVPEIVWGAVPVMLFWISWVWLIAHRGLMHDDPLIFALKDRASLISGLVFTAVIFIGSVGWPW